MEMISIQLTNNGNMLMTDFITTFTVHERSTRSTSNNKNMANSQTRINVGVKILTKLIDRTGSKTASGQVIDSISTNINTLFLTYATKKDNFKVKSFYLLRNVSRSEFIRFSDNFLAMECSEFPFPPLT